MKKLSVLLSILFLFTVSSKAQQYAIPISDSMIRHTVAFKLKYPKDSYEEGEFFKAANTLATIPGVHNFKSFRETSKKNDFDYFFYMEFESQKDYDGYNQHPDHIQFVEKFWVNDEDKFLEIDYEVLK